MHWPPGAWSDNPGVIAVGCSASILERQEVKSKERAASDEKGSHVFHQIYNRRCPIACRGELRPTDDKFKGRGRVPRAARADGR